MSFRRDLNNVSRHSGGSFIHIMGTGIVYGHIWLYEETLTSMQFFYGTKVSKKKMKGSLGNPKLWFYGIETLLEPLFLRVYELLMSILLFYTLTVC